jgi:hypothetical protein
MQLLLNRNLILVSTVAFALLAIAYLVLALLTDPAQAAIRPRDPYDPCPGFAPYCS